MMIILMNFTIEFETKILVFSEIEAVEYLLSLMLLCTTEAVINLYRRNCKLVDNSFILPKIISLYVFEHLLDPSCSLVLYHVIFSISGPSYPAPISHFRCSAVQRLPAHSIHFLRFRSSMR